MKLRFGFCGIGALVAGFFLVLPIAQADLIYTDADSGKTKIFFEEQGSVMRATCVNAKPAARKDCLLKEKIHLFKLNDAVSYFTLGLSSVSVTGKELLPLTAEQVSNLTMGALPSQWAVASKQAQLKTNETQATGKALKQILKDEKSLDDFVALHANFDESEKDFAPYVESFLSAINSAVIHDFSDNAGATDLEKALVKMIATKHIPRDCIALSGSDLKAGDKVLLHEIDQTNEKDPLTNWAWTKKFAGTVVKYKFSDAMFDEDGCSFVYVNVPLYDVPWRLRNLSFVNTAK